VLSLVKKTELVAVAHSCLLVLQSLISTQLFPLFEELISQRDMLRCEVMQLQH
jgi:hypothetical protein